MYGLEIVTLTKGGAGGGRAEDVKIFIESDQEGQNQYIRWTAQVERFGDKVREAKLRLSGYVQRRNSGYIGQRMLEDPCRKQRESLHRRLGM